MPSNYPANIDTWPTIGPLLSSTPHSEIHEDLQDAVEAVQTELGTNPAGAFATVNQRAGASEFAMEQMRRVYADQAALVDATPGEFVGQRVWVSGEEREYLWDGTHWKIIGGNWPGVRLVRKTTHHVSTVGSQILLSGHTGAGAPTFRTGDILTVPAGAGGIYHLDFGAEFSQGADAGYSVAVLIGNNDTTYGWEPTQFVAPMNYDSTNPVFPIVNFSRMIALEPGATITFSGRTTVASRGPMMSWIGLTMHTHLPGLE